ncbi:MAG: hypothetical protein LWW85_15175 [Marinilabiliales bacterium]|nr:hypothetical protein [Marinilabiliales bacterium]
MENEINTPSQPKGAREFFKSAGFWKPFLAALAGGLVGFLYYYFVGCSSGSCAITSNPYASILWGALLGYFLVNSPCSKGAC